MDREAINGKMGRRRFAGLLAGLLTTLLALLTGWMTRRSGDLKAKKEVVLPAGLPEGISFAQGIIIVRKGDRMTLLSSRCTHLGCRIRESTDGHLQCPCHGSQFAADGTVLKGPATQPLKVLKWRREKGGIVVYNS